MYISELIVLQYYHNKEGGSSPKPNYYSILFGFLHPIEHKLGHCGWQGFYWSILHFKFGRFLYIFCIKREVIIKDPAAF